VQIQILGPDGSLGLVERQIIALLLDDEIQDLRASLAGILPDRIITPNYTIPKA
jgi:hypothetical protein